MRAGRTTKGKSRVRGVALFEVTLSLATLIIIAMVSMKASLNVVEAQRWTLIQSLSDAYLTREVARANRVPFSDLKNPEITQWPTYPESTSEEVEIGRLPGSIPVAANLVRTKYPARGNLISKGGESTNSMNPTRMETWLIKSFLTYRLAGREYVKARTTIRVR